MDSKERELFQLLEIEPDLKKEILEKIRAHKEIKSIKKILEGLKIQLIGATKDLYWFQNHAGAFTVPKNNFSRQELIQTYGAFKKRYGL